MKKRWLALLLTLVMLLSLGVTALAVEIRETDFFEELEHGDVDFGELKYVPVDTEAILAAMDETRALAQDAANADAVREGFLTACGMYTDAETMYVLSYIYYQMDQSRFGDYDDANDAVMVVGDALYALVRDILLSPCAEALDGLVTEEEAEELRDYEDMTEEELAIQDELNALENEYYAAAAAECTAVVDGTEWTRDLAYSAYIMGQLSYDEYRNVNLALEKAENAVLGELYLRIVDAHKRQAALEDCDSFADYAYEYYFQRSYTPRDVRDFHAAVKAYMAPLSAKIKEVYRDLGRSLRDGEAVYADYYGDIALDVMEPYIAALSGELYESFTYMRQHGFYDSDYSPMKAEGAFTITLSAYRAPFFYDQPVGTATDLLSAIHEFGHYNHCYWFDDRWYHGAKDKDTNEVHSQGLEFLFMELYPQIFGEEGGRFLTAFQLYNTVSGSIIDGALYDELQQFAFETENVTLQQLNEEYARLCREYGKADADDGRTEMYDWVGIPHTFVSPFYYISYATSAAGALEFWLEAREDYFAAVDDYLRFTAQKLDEYDFRESFEAVGLRSPFSAEFIASLAQELTDFVDSFRNPTAAEYFSDVTGGERWYEAVDALYSCGYLNGVEEGVLAPDAALTRAQAAAVLCRLFEVTEARGADYFTDVTEGRWYTDMVNGAYEADLLHGFEDGSFRPGENMSRQDFAVVLYNIFTNYLGSGFHGLWSFDLDAADGDAVGGYALEAVSWGVMNGYITPDGDSMLRPADDLTRAEMAEMIYLAFFAD